ncbi:MAG: hypothetical protein ABIB41_09460 [Nitrospirota bacterium]
MDSNNSTFGLQKGIVAKSLRKVLHSDLTDHDVEGISIILICHLMIENRINKLLYNWLTDSIPYMGSKGDKDAVIHNKKVRKQAEDNIVKLDFVKKVALIKPLATALWKKDGEEILKEIYEVNNIRNDIFHHLKIKEAKFKGKLLSSEKGLKFFVDVTHQRLLNIDDLIELIAKKDKN